MTFRTVVRDGLIVINTHGEIPDGTPVELVRIPSEKGRRGASRQKSGDTFVAIVGAWRDQPAWKGKSSVEVATELRRRRMGERHGRRPASRSPRS
jgi:hypothetical protein